MSSIPERISCLRGVYLFVQSPEDVLEEVAEILEPVFAPAGQTIFQKGDKGDCMYLIQMGCVKVHDGDLVLNELKTSAVFGEMALLDAEPRMASVTAVEDTHLFRLDQEPFYRLMSSRGEMSRGIIHVLTRYIRERVSERREDFLYIQQMGHITDAAIALESGRYEPQMLDEVMQRTDALGHLARVFRRMAQEVYTREQNLRAQIHELTIEINEARKSHQVDEIVETDFFQGLQKRANDLRERKKRS